MAFPIFALWIVLVAPLNVCGAPTKGLPSLNDDTTCVTPESMRLGHH